MDFKEIGCEDVDWIPLAQDPHEHGNEPSNFVRHSTLQILSVNSYLPNCFKLAALIYESAIQR
jgi:hypothetical protein